MYLLNMILRMSSLNKYQNNVNSGCKVQAGLHKRWKKCTTLQSVDVDTV